MVGLLVGLLTLRPIDVVVGQSVGPLLYLLGGSTVGWLVGWLLVGLLVGWLAIEAKVGKVIFTPGFLRPSLCAIHIYQITF